MTDVIVVGRNYPITLEAVRSLGEAGFGVRLLALFELTFQIAGKSKYVKQRFLTGTSFEEMWRGLEKLRGTDEHILVIPLSDGACMVLDEHAEQMQKHYVIPSVRDGIGGIAGAMDKMLQKHTAQQCGLLTASGESYATDEEGIARAVSEASYPCFQKPLASVKTINGSKTCFARCANQEELQDAMKAARENGCGTVLLEEYLPIEKELSAYGVAANGQVFIPACMEALRGGFNHQRGVASEGIVKSARCFGETKEKLEEFVKVIGLSGLFCIDLIQSDGKLYFSEINLRAGGSQYAITLAGANLPAALADMVYDHSAESPRDIRRDVHFLNEYIEALAYSQGFISRKEFNAHMSGQSERMIQNADDPRPWREYQLRVLLKKRMKAGLKEILHM